MRGGGAAIGCKAGEGVEDWHGCEMRGDSGRCAGVVPNLSHASFPHEGMDGVTAAVPFVTPALKFRRRTGGKALRFWRMREC
jgi:hypothetical protein